MGLSSNKLRLLLSAPNDIAQFSMADWDVIIRQARASNLLYKLYLICRNHKSGVPEEVLRHLNATLHVGGRFERSVKDEVGCINAALNSSGLPVILLKGAAYVFRELNAGKGRLFSDVDILVDRERLPNAEMALKKFGWFVSEYDEYNDRYYRTWMHEIPALTHVNRGSILDVHHAISPPSSNINVDTSKLLNNIEAVNALDNVFTLSSVDMVLHSAVHLFQDGEFDNGFRDLVDLDELMREFVSRDSNFFHLLLERSSELNLERPLFYAMRYAQRFLCTPVPDVCSSVSKAAPLFPWLMDFLFERALMPAHSTCDDKFTPFARWVLYVRAHYLRMPLYLLIPHLIRKAYMKRVKKNKTATAE